MHVQPRLNPICARYRFNSEIQGADSIDAFVTRLRIFVCTSPKVREKLLNEGEKLTMHKAIQVDQNYEYCQEQLPSIAMSDTNNFHVINKRFGEQTGNTRQWPVHSSTYRPGQQNTRKQIQSGNVQCGICGTSHVKNKSVIPITNYFSLKQQVTKPC